MADAITIVREFEAPRERVWAEWTEPERFADWYGGPDAHNPLDSVSMDLREGGAWRLTMFYGAERREIRWHGEYREIVPPERLVFTISDRPPQDSEYAECTVLLEDLGDRRTRMRFEQGEPLPPDPAAAKTGWGVFFDRLTARLEEA
jgi:uncharacterized protein YndB with AHSA1/START domain